MKNINFNAKTIGSTATYLAAGIFIVLINLVWFLPTIETMRHQISQNQVEVIKRAQSTIDSFLNKQIHDLELVGIFLNQDLDDPANKIAIERILNNSEFINIALLDSEGKEVQRSDKLSVILEKDVTDFSETPEFIQVTNSKLPYFSPIRFTENLEPLTKISVPVSFIKGDVDGVLIAEFNIRSLFTELDNIRSASGGYVYVVDRKGNLISHIDPSLVLQQSNRYDLRIISETLAGQKDILISDDNYYTYENENATKVLSAGGLVDETNWGIIFEEPKSLAEASIIKIEAFAIIIVLLSFGVLIFLRIVNNRIIESKKAVVSALEKATRLGKEQSFLANLGKKILDNGDIKDLLKAIPQEVSSILGMEYVKILELTEDKEEFVLRAGTGWKEGYVGHATVEADTTSQAGFTLISKHPVVVSDFSKETRFTCPALLKEHNVVSGMSVNIHSSDEEKPFGILGVHSASLHNITDEDVNFLRLVANVISEALSKKNNESLIAEHLDEVERMNKLMVGRELKMVELKKKIKELGGEKE